MSGRWRAVVSGIAVGAVCAGLLLVPQVRLLERQAGLWWLFQLRGAAEPPDDVALVLMNQDSAANISLPREAERFHRCEDLRVGAAPSTHVSLPAMPSRWPRCVHAHLLDRLEEAGAALIAFDVLFRQRPPLPGTQGDLHEWQDQALAAAAGRVRMVIAQKVESVDGHETLADLSPAIANAALGSAPFPLVVESGRRIDRFMAFKEEGLVTPTLPAIALQAFAIDGYPFLFDFLTEHAGESAELLPRSAQDLESQGSLQATMLLIRQMLRDEPGLAPKLRKKALTAARDSGDAVAGRGIGSLAALYAGEGTRLVNLYGPAGRIPSYGYDQVLTSTAAANAARFRGRVVFVGFGETTRAEQIEHFSTAFSAEEGADLSGVEIAATAFSNLLEDRTIRELPLRYWVALTFIAGLLSYVVADRLGNRAALAVIAFAAGAYAIVALYLFGARQLWIPTVIPLILAVPAGTLTAFAWKFWTAHTERAHLRHAFSYFVPREVVEALERNAGEIGASRESIECGCVATDAANFTPLAESMTPEQLTEFLNHYFEALFGQVAARGGFVSDVVGDAMLAIWPHRSLDTHHRLLQALLAMRDAAQRFNERLAGNRLMTRFGVDWGRVALSTVGAHAHYEYRAVGDTVNTATRIQELNKKLGTRILVSHAAIADADRDFLLRDAGRFLLRGKSHAVHVFELLESRDKARNSDAVLCVRFLEGVRAVDQGELSVARAHFKAIQDEFPADGPTSFYLRSLDSGLKRHGGAWVID